MPLRRDDIPTAVLERVNTALNDARQDLGLTSDTQLAAHWNIAPKTISLWRNGVWTDNDAILIGALVGVRFWRARPLKQRAIQSAA